MSSHFSDIAGILAKVSFKYILLLVLIVFMSLLGIVLSLVALGLADPSGSLGHGAHAGPIVLLFWFVVHFPSAILFFATLLLSIFYFMTANKYCLSYALHLLWKKKLSGWVLEKTELYLKKLESKQPGWLKDASGVVTVKAKLIQEISIDKTIPSLQRRVLKFALKKTALDQINGVQAESTWSDLILQKVNQTISEIGKPSFSMFWVLLGLHAFLMFFAFLM